MGGLPSVDQFWSVHISGSGGFSSAIVTTHLPFLPWWCHHCHLSSKTTFIASTIRATDRQGGRGSGEGRGSKGVMIMIVTKGKAKRGRESVRGGRQELSRHATGVLNVRLSSVGSMPLRTKLLRRISQACRVCVP